MSLNLYEAILGNAWLSLPEAVRTAHDPGFERRGRFRVTHGSRLLARIVLAVSGLPAESDFAETRLRIHDREGRQVWERHFDGDHLRTEQWTERDGLLHEQFGFLEISFELSVERASLRYLQRNVWLRLGGLRVPLPQVCAPRVTADESGGANRVNVVVEVQFPVACLLIRYEGFLELEERTP